MTTNPTVSILVSVLKTKRQAPGTRKSQRKLPKREQLKPKRLDALGKETKTLVNGCKRLSV